MYSTKSSLTWLIINDFNRMDNLLKNYGYDIEEGINKKAITRAYEFYENQVNNEHIKYNYCENLLYYRECKNNNLKINKGVFKSIESLTNETDSRYIEMIYDYLNNINSGSVNTDLTDDEKVELFFHFGQIEIDLRKKRLHGVIDNQNGVGWHDAYAAVSGLLNGYNYHEIAKKHNYFNIENCIEIIRVADWEQPIVEGEDESVMPFDYETLK